MNTAIIKNEEKLTRLIIRIVRRIRTHTIENPIPSKILEMEYSINGGKLRRIINNIRKEGEPIGSNLNGYYYARSYDEIKPVIDSFREHAYDRLSTAARLEKRFNGEVVTLWEQIENENGE